MAAKLLQMMMLVMLMFIKQAFAKNTDHRPAVLPGCQERCGSLNISYPFGIGAKCSASKPMEIYCNSSFNPPKAFLRDQDNNSLEVLNISVETGTIRINYPITTDCMNTSDNPASPHVRLALPLTFSNNENRFTALGCDNIALLSSFSESFPQVLETGGCLSRCNPQLNTGNSCFGINCCQTKFPPNLFYVQPSISNRNISPSGCRPTRYAFIVDQNWFGKLDNIYSVQTMETVPAVLNWKAFGACRTFHEPVNPVENATVCGVNALCTNQSLCSCTEGFEGNPYLRDGCQDINECAGSKADPRIRPLSIMPKTPKVKLNEYNFKNSARPPIFLGATVPGSSLKFNRCEHYCTNTPGSYTCSCKDGWALVEKFKCVKLDFGKSRAKKAAIIAATATIAGVGVLLVTIYLYQVIEQRNVNELRKKFFNMNGGRLLLQLLASSSERNKENTKLFTAKELEKATDGYNVDRIVGQGGQGAVYKGMLTDGRIVAVKKSKIEDKSKLEHFINEVVTLSQMNHRNLVKLHGCCLETEVPLLVYEFIPNGTLLQYIHEENEYFPLTWDVRLRVATEVAGALSYLHSASPNPIYHRDIKSTNILLDEKYRAKVADFGFSRSFSLDQTHLTTGAQGTSGYLDPEYIKSRQFTDKSDVYSFGVVLVELLTGQKPISSAGLEDDARDLATLFLLAMEEDRVLDIIDSRIINEEKKEEMITFANIAYRCLNLNGRKRPTMKQVVAELESIRNTRESPTAQQNDEEVDYGKHDPNALWESDVNSSSVSSTMIDSITDKISNFL